MTVESATYLSQLDTSLPTGSDAKSEGDNHLRLLKSVLKTTFPNISAAVTPDATELNKLDGVTVTTAEINYLASLTGNIQAQLGTKAPIANPTFTGTVTVPSLVLGATALTASATELNQLTSKLLASGQYTPGSITNLLNVASSTIYQLNYFRFGDMVLVFGAISVDPTSVGATAFRMPLPIASNLTTAFQLAGSGSWEGSTWDLVRITGDSTNNEARFDWVAGNSGVSFISFMFAYQILP